MGDGMPNSEKPRAFTRADKRLVSDADIQGPTEASWRGRSGDGETYLNRPRGGADRYDNDSSYRIRLGSKQDSRSAREETRGTGDADQKKPTRMGARSLKGFSKRFERRRSK